MIAKFEYLSKKEVKEFVEKTITGINNELSKINKPLLNFNLNIIFPLKNNTTIINCVGVCFEIINTNKLKYDLIIK